MKKQYIQPESHVVVVKLIGSVLETKEAMIAASRKGAMRLGSREFDDRFDDFDDDCDWE